MFGSNDLFEEAWFIRSVTVARLPRWHEAYSARESPGIALREVLRKAIAEKDVDFCLGLLTLDDLPGRAAAV
eukprot:Skav232694  [mRNA]  locus=scaffold860:46322:46537:- [translate_table: standard]